ncbi:MAG: PPOX class F420-dependent oxidoreductase [Caldilineales bacterium]|nr:PPOX class F420-dependent oxidoreductase [Caldilineales bacterium]
MAVTIPDAHKDLVEGAVYAVLTTVAPNGQPENTVIWCSWDGEHVLVNTADGRRKADNIKRNPRVALTAVDPQNPFRWVDIRGVVESVEEDDDFSNINKHCFIYTGNEEYYGSVQPAEMKGQEKRLVFNIKPERVLVFPPPGQN